MTINKANFLIDDKVKIHSTISELDGITGSIIGFASKHPEMDFYIVLLDCALPYSDVKALVMTEHCLTRFK
jgi:hypothetical protein